MTVHPLRPPAPVTDQVARACAAVAAGAATPMGEVDSGELAAAIVGLTELEAQAQALKLRLVAEADARELAEAQAATGTDAWWARLTGDTRERANGGVWLANQLESRFHATREAFAAGKVQLNQVWVIVKAAEKIPSWATAEQVAMAEEWLVAKATGVGNRNGRPMNTKQLRQAARRMCAPISTELADAHEAALLNRERDHAEAETWFTLHDHGDGTYRGRFVIPELHGQLLQGFLQQLSAPRRWSRDKAGNPVDDQTTPGECGHNWSEKLGLALCELLENLPAGGWSRNGINIVVTTTLDTLRTGLGAAGLDTGTHIAPSELRRLACNAGIIPAVLGGDSVPLDLGRKRRLHSRHQRIALSLIHDSCAAAGCDRPFAWTEIHHPHPWAQGGSTDMDGIPLCHYHHRRAHDHRWDLHQDQTGEWRFRRRKNLSAA